MPIPVARTTRSPRRLTSRPATGADTKRTNANTEMTAPAAKLLTPKFLANSGIAGATIPKPRATENATAVRTATSGGRDPKGLRRARIRSPILAGRDDRRYVVREVSESVVSRIALSVAACRQPGRFVSRGVSSGGDRRQ